ncbi:MAG: hypothetical protein KGL39_47605 [Patescibacteria group bacterium]|nr:hypothetical protein [Patescibacteria group bacterium]
MAQFCEACGHLSRLHTGSNWECSEDISVANAHAGCGCTEPQPYPECIEPEHDFYDTGENGERECVYCGLVVA